MCVENGIVADEYSFLSTRFTTCLPYFKVESKITRDFEAQCSLFTYKHFIHIYTIQIILQTINIPSLLWAYQSLLLYFKTFFFLNKVNVNITNTYNMWQYCSL